MGTGRISHFRELLQHFVHISVVLLPFLAIPHEICNFVEREHFTEHK